jgi:hypothetical protein
MAKPFLNALLKLWHNCGISQWTHEQCDCILVPVLDDRKHFANQIRCFFAYRETLPIFKLALLNKYIRTANF